MGGLPQWWYSWLHGTLSRQQCSQRSKHSHPWQLRVTNDHLCTTLLLSFTQHLYAFSYWLREATQPNHRPDQSNVISKVCAFRKAVIMLLLYAPAYSGLKRDSWVSSGHKRFWSDYRRSLGTNDIKNSNTLPRPDGNHSRVLKQFKDEVAELLRDLCNLSFKTVWVLRTGG